MSRETREPSEEDPGRVVITQDYDGGAHSYNVNLGGRLFANCTRQSNGKLAFNWRSTSDLDDTSQSRVAEQSLSDLTQTILGRPLDFEKPAGFKITATIKNIDALYSFESVDYEFTWETAKRRDYWEKLSEDGVYRREVKYEVVDQTIRDLKQPKTLMFKTTRDPFDIGMQLHVSSAIGLSEDVVRWISGHNKHVLRDGEARAISSTLLENFSKEPVVKLRKYL